MSLVNFNIVLEIIIAFMIIISTLFTFSKIFKKFLSNGIIKNIDQNSTKCYLTDTLNLVNENSKHINDLLKINKQISDKLDKFVDSQAEINRTSKRLEIMRLIDHDPNQVLLVSSLYDEYKKGGGNSYIDNLYNNYITKYGKNT